MQQKPKFVRSANLNDKLQEQARAYDKLIRTLFDIQSSNLPRNQKIERLKNEYNTISQKDVEKNSIFIERLECLCKEMKQSKAGLNRFLVDALKLFCSAELLDLITLQDLTGDPSISIEKEPDLVPVKVKTAEEQIQHFLDELIKRKVGEHLRREKDAEVKKLLSELQNINFAELDSNIDKFEFEQYGSSQNGFSLQDSDYDISIATKDPVDERKMLNFFYEKAKDILKDLVGRDGFQITRITHENIRIPLVRIRLVKENLDLSFAVNSQLEIWNTHLIKAYSEFDKRCYKLGLLVKIWARTHKVVSSQKNYLSSYGFMLLVIHFLQNLKDPILPNLQGLSKGEKHIQVCRKINQGKLETFDARIDYEKDVKILEEIKLQYSNKMTDIELFREFFKYYQEKENFKNKKISIREGSLLPRSLEGEEKNYLYSIEDPFDSRHNPGRTLQQGSPQAEELINTMKKSYELLEQGKFKEVFQPYL